MAEEKVIVIEEESTELSEVKKSPFNKKNLILIIALLFVLILLLLSLFFIIKSKKNSENKQESLTQLIKESPVSIEQFQSKKLDIMIAKANSLYESGDKNEALKLYENIAKYNESFSNYNLGVSRMKQENYKDALTSFKKALENNENNTVAALNAAVCALYLNNKKEFNYYIDLAYSYLNNEQESALYYYYLGLINYYKGFYPEALQALSKNKNKVYQDDSNYLQAKIYSILNDEKRAITKLQEVSNYDNSLTLGLLYAKNAEFNKAKFYLTNALERKKESDLVRLSLAFVDLKVADYKESSELFAYLLKNNKDLLENKYYVQTIINKRLSDIDYAQSLYDKNFLSSKQQQYDLIFYYSPFLVFNAKNAMKLINKANVNIFLDDYSSANAFLQDSNTISNIDIQISKALNLAFNYNIEKASEIFQDLVKQYPQHSILQYDLALTYALLNKYDLAKKHFIASYHLDPNNTQAGIYALYCADILLDEDIRLEQDVSENVKNQNKAYTKALLAVKTKDYVQMQDFLNSKYEKNPFNMILKIICDFVNLNTDNLVNDAKVLNDISNNDIIANILYFSLKNTNKDIKKYARDIQIYFLNKNLDYRALFGGARIVSLNYVKLMQISGLLASEREKLKELLKTSNEVGILKALAYLDIYANEFEESYTIYNSLIDDYQIQDSQTFFLASVAAIGANHPNSAIALLELSRVKNPQNLESRFALALLYLQARNYDAAISQLEKINNGFFSSYFSFTLSSSK